MKKAKKEKAAAGKGRKIILIITIFAVALAATFGVVVAFNIGNFGVKANNCLASLPVARNFFKPIGPVKTPQQLELEKLEKQKKQLEQEQAQLDELSIKLAQWEVQLKAKESELIEQENNLEKLQQKLESRLNDITELTEYYEKMDSKDAVEILNNIGDNQLIVIILKNMKQQSASEILALMEPLRAARLMEMMAPQE